MALFWDKTKESKEDENEYIVPKVPFYEEEEEDCNNEVVEEEVTTSAVTHSTGWGEWVALAAITVCLSWLFQCSVFQAFNVPSRSMEPSLLVGDSVIVDKLAYGFYFPESSRPFYSRPGPERNDVVAFILGNEKKVRRTFVFDEYLIKRVVALPGDVMEVKNGVTYVNGSPLIDFNRYRKLPKVDRSPERLAENQYFLLGDNAELSEDSRFFGAVSRSAIIGRVVMIYWSRENTDKTYQLRFYRIGKLL